MRLRKMGSDPSHLRLAQQNQTIPRSPLDRGSESHSFQNQQVLTLVLYLPCSPAGARNGERSGSGSGIAAMSILA
jgi:hypothetical protein